MKHVSNGQPPREFEDWKAGGNADWQPAYANLQSPQKQVLHRSLLTEQGWVCCYCGRRVGLAASHIEHFRPQESRPDLALSYDNLHASCIGGTPPPPSPPSGDERRMPVPLHCGHAKGCDFDELRHLSPLRLHMGRSYRGGRSGRFASSLYGRLAQAQ